MSLHTKTLQAMVVSTVVAARSVVCCGVGWQADCYLMKAKYNTSSLTVAVSLALTISINGTITTCTTVGFLPSSLLLVSCTVWDLPRAMYFLPLAMYYY